MNEDYTIIVPFDEKELQEMLYEDRSFQWVFPTEEDGDVQITIKLFKEECEIKERDIPSEMCQDLLDLAKKKNNRYAPATKQAVEQTSDG